MVVDKRYMISRTSAQLPSKSVESILTVCFISLLYAVLPFIYHPSHTYHAYTVVRVYISDNFSSQNIGNFLYWKGKNKGQQHLSLTSKMTRMTITKLFIWVFSNLTMLHCCSTIGGAKTSRNVALRQQRQWKRWLKTSKRGFKQCRISTILKNRLCKHLIRKEMIVGHIS